MSNSENNKEKDAVASAVDAIVMHLVENGKKLDRIVELLEKEENTDSNKRQNIMEMDALEFVNAYPVPSRVFYTVDQRYRFEKEPLKVSDLYHDGRRYGSIGRKTLNDLKSLIDNVLDA